MDPDLPRFINQDSYLGEVGMPPSLHRYLYAFGNPTVYVDPDGHFAWFAPLIAYSLYTGVNTSTDTAADVAIEESVNLATGQESTTTVESTAQSFGENYVGNFFTGGAYGKVKNAKRVAKVAEEINQYRKRQKKVGGDIKITKESQDGSTTTITSTESLSAKNDKIIESANLENLGSGRGSYGGSQGRQRTIDDTELEFTGSGKSGIGTKQTVEKNTEKIEGFSIIDWKGYPSGVPKPEGPVRLLEGAEYDAARKAANKANNKIRKKKNLRGQPVDVHEIKPVKFGGSPTDPANKAILDRSLHRQQVTPWWNKLLKDVRE